ncbi:MAG: PAS domain-containing sensor histidine kinase [Romboutsia sp.]
MKDAIYVKYGNIKSRGNSIAYIMFIAALILLAIVENIALYAIFIYASYAVNLICISIIIINNIRFNPDKSLIFLGTISCTIGILEIIYVILGINFRNSPEFVLGIRRGLYTIIDILPVVAIYLSIRYIDSNKVVFKYVLAAIVSIISVGIGSFIFIKNFNFLKIETINIKYYLLELLVTIFIFTIAFIVNRRIKDNKINLDKYKLDLIRKIVVILSIARIPVLIHFIIKNIYIEHILRQIIINIGMYYLYEYVVYSNVRKPYEKLNDKNRELINKTIKIKETNAKLVGETKKTQDLKTILRKKEAKLNCTLDGTSHLIIVFDSEKNITYYNETFTNVFGKISYSNFVNKVNDYTIMEKGIKFVVNTLESKKIFIHTVENRIYECVLTPLIIKDKLEGVLCILIDKTNIKQTEEKIKNENTRHINFLESLDDGIVVIEDGKITYVNKACMRIFKGEIDKIDFYIDDESTSKEEVYIIDGNKIYVEMSFSEYVRYNKNKMIVVIRDITKRRIDQEKLKESQESYSRFIDILPDGICLLEDDLSIYYANKSLLEILDIDCTDNIKGLNIKDIINLNKSEKSEFEYRIKKVFNNKESMFIMDVEILSIYNKKVQVEINALPFSKEEKQYIMCIFQDISNRKRWEIAEEELVNIVNNDKIKTEFFANMSHELKTPLNVIYSCNQLIESIYRGGKIKDYNNNIEYHIELVKQNSYRLQRLINNIIDFTKMESNLYKLKLAKYNIVEIIEDLFMEVETYAAKKNISLIFDTNTEEIYIYIDKFQMERVILNLLSNCIKFTNNDGYIYLNINCEFDKVEISVKDTGVGIPKNQLDSIFNEFSQVDKTLSRSAEGSGIGLAIVKKLVNLHGGLINVISEENKGTEFTISLPTQKVNDSNRQEDKSIYNIKEQIKIEFSDIYY